jgi:hypothetical protein
VPIQSDWYDERDCHSMNRESVAAAVPDFDDRTACVGLGRLVVTGLVAICGGLLSPTVGAVEAGALEHHTDGPVHLPNRLTADWTFRHRLVGKRLHELEPVAARGVCARVLIGGHRRTVLRQLALDY